MALLAPTQALRIGLRALLTEDSQVEVLGEAVGPSGLDPFLEDTDVIVAASARSSLATELQENLPDNSPYPAILLLADLPHNFHTLLAMPFRAVGILPEDASAQEISSALHSLHEGLMVGPYSLLSVLLEGPLASNRLAVDIEDNQPIEPLTPRETEVLQHLAYGLPNKQISQALKISEHTVKFHISSIYNKLGATNRTEAVRAGARAGLIVL